MTTRDFSPIDFTAGRNLDRQVDDGFGEQRFTRREIEQMMHAAGLRGIVFRDAAPFWTALGIKPEN